jgi:predicted NAD-dependent protein-ADP-ribosyltransferase YbiA (DUF1768 family)
LKELSNLYECDIVYHGNEYNSVEHVYQSIKFIENDRKRFMKNGDLGGYNGLIVNGEIFYGQKVAGDNDALVKKMMYWKKKDCVGIVAKMSSNPKYAPKLGLTFLPVKSDDETIKIFKEVLLIKFKLQPFKAILKNTGSKFLVEFSRSAKRNHENNVVEKWCGLIDNGILYGKNLMGDIMMDVRNKL